MITVRKGSDRGRTKIDWLDSFHTFSFGDYIDPQQRGFRVLRVINEDWVQPGSGFEPHPHQDMEIVTYIVSGALEHKDSMGNGSVIRAGELQRMTAGTGIIHSEFNPSRDEIVHLLQIWIFPKQKGLTPSYEQKNFENTKDGLNLVATGFGELGALTLHQDARIWLARPSNAPLTFENKKGRFSWLHVISGQVQLGDNKLVARDGAAIAGDTTVKMTGGKDTRALLFDLP